MHVPENWLSNVELKPKGLNRLMSEYNDTLVEMVNLLESRSDDFLQEEYYDTDFKRDCTYEFLLCGMIHHDIYYLGQIGIIIKFLNRRNTTTEDV